MYEALLLRAQSHQTAINSLRGRTIHLALPLLFSPLTEMLSIESDKLILRANRREVVKECVGRKSLPVAAWW